MKINKTNQTNKTTEHINALAAQQRLAIQACYTILMKDQKKVYIGQVYEVYKNIV